MNAVDIAILGIVLLAALKGFRQGFVVEVALILGAVAALAIAKTEYVPVRSALETIASKSPWLTVISYLGVFVVVWSIIVAVARLVRRLMRLLLLGLLDRLAGAVLGAIEGVIVVELLLYLGKRVPSQDLRRLIKQSQLAPNFINLVPYLHNLFPHVPTH